MSDPNRSFTTSLASVLADLGVRHACLSPGSRNTPLIAGFAAEDRITKWPILDERSAGFFATGLAKATGSPVVLACTSGTAAVEYHPAVVEASHSGVPLLVLTADRPEELRNVGAPQTIDQLSLYGSAPRLFIDATPPDASTTQQDAVDLATTIWEATGGDNPGPVHLNLPFRDPLLKTTPAIQTASRLELIQQETQPLRLAEIGQLLDGRKGIIVAGRITDPSFPLACTELAAATMWPILADPLSGLRHGKHRLERVLAHADPLAAAGALDQLQPEVVLRFGPVPTSKPVWKWLEDHPDTDQILIDPGVRDATHSASTTLALPVAAAALALVDAVNKPAPPGWADQWAALDIVAGQAITDELARAPFPNEPTIARIVIDSAPSGSIVTVGSSMPIRDVDTFGGTTSKAIQLQGNRGANGIDGIVSAALGTAASGSPAIALLGDVSLFHDTNALGTAVQLGLPLTIVVVHNDGGGIFHFLPQHDPDIMAPETFEKYLATPHDTNFVPIATAFGLATHEVTDVENLRRLLSTPAEGPRLIQLRTNREDNLQLHHTLAMAVRHALR